MTDAIEKTIQEFVARDIRVQHCSQFSRFSRPALEYEQASGLKGIGVHYKIPDGKSDAELARDLLAVTVRHQAVTSFLSLARSIGDISPESADRRLARSQAELNRAESAHFALARQAAKGEYVAGNDMEETARKHGYFDGRLKVAKAFSQLIHAHPETTLADFEAVAQTTEKPSEIFQRIYQELKILNPSLEALECDLENTKSLEDVILGVTSGFNVDDIDFYSIQGMCSDTASQDWQEKKNILETKTGLRIVWIPSEKTLDRALEQLKARKSNPQPELGAAGWGKKIFTERQAESERQP